MNNSSICPISLFKETLSWIWKSRTFLRRRYPKLRFALRFCGDVIQISDSLSAFAETFSRIWTSRTFLCCCSFRRCSMNNQSIYPISLFVNAFIIPFFRITLFYVAYLLGTALGGAGFSFGIFFMWIPSLLTGWGIITYALLLMLTLYLIKTENPKTVHLIILCTFIIATLDSWRVISFLTSK